MICYNHTEWPIVFYMKRLGYHHSESHLKFYIYFSYLSIPFALNSLIHYFKILDLYVGLYNPSSHYGMRYDVNNQMQLNVEIHFQYRHNKEVTLSSKWTGNEFSFALADGECKALKSEIRKVSTRKQRQKPFPDNQ